MLHRVSCKRWLWPRERACQVGEPFQAAEVLHQVGAVWPLPWAELCQLPLGGRRFQLSIIHPEEVSEILQQPSPAHAQVSGVLKAIALGRACAQCMHQLVPLDAAELPCSGCSP